MDKAIPDPASFRDPAGFIFCRDGEVYRQINTVYKPHYEHLMKSGLYSRLHESGLLIGHQVVGGPTRGEDSAYSVIKPERLSFISYPYEWCFGQLKAAALHTLQVQKQALELGMSLKDASAYNIQFEGPSPVFIDTLSFEICEDGQPWKAYGQFCKHFLAPLALMHFKDIRLSGLFRVHLDGIPLDLASCLLPLRSWFDFATAVHIHLHALGQRRYANKAVDVHRRRVSKASLLGLVSSLEAGVMSMRSKTFTSDWSTYYDNNTYSLEAFDHKREVVSHFLDIAQPETVWDLGANTGAFSSVSGRKGIRTISFDVDPLAVERNYQECVNTGITNILPLVLDLTNPSPPQGWAHRERKSLVERGPVDLVMCLALIHHLAIANNVPFMSMAEFMKEICRFLIIEFVPKSDSQVVRLLSSREDIFSLYTREHFEESFGHYFKFCEAIDIRESDRTLYLMERL